MTVTIDVTQDQIYGALRAFLLAALPAGTEVVQAQVNRVPEVPSDDFIVMNDVNRLRLATNVDTYTDGYPDTPSVKSARQATSLTIQLDVHGPAGSDNAQIITTLFRDDFAVDQFKASGLPIAPLYCSEARQLPYLNGEQQIEARWVVDAVLQVNASVTVSQQFFDAVSIDLIEVDGTYPPA